MLVSHKRSILHDHGNIARWSKRVKSILSKCPIAYPSTVCVAGHAQYMSIRFRDHETGHFSWLMVTIGVSVLATLPFSFSSRAHPHLKHEDTRVDHWLGNLALDLAFGVP